MLQETLESHLNSKEVKPLICKGNKSLIFIGRTDAEAEAPILRSKNRLLQRTDSLEKSLMLGKIEGRRRRGWQRMHHWLNGHEFEQAPGDSEGQGSLVCYSPWGHKEADMAGQLNNNTFRHGRIPACSHDVSWHCECHNISWQEAQSSGFTWYLGY